MADKNFKVKNGITIQGTTDRVITANNSGSILIGGSPISLATAYTPTTGQFYDNGPNTILTLPNTGYPNDTYNQYEVDVSLAIDGAWRAHYMAKLFIIDFYGEILINPYAQVSNNTSDFPVSSVSYSAGSYQSRQIKIATSSLGGGSIDTWAGITNFVVRPNNDYM